MKHISVPSLWKSTIPIRAEDFFSPSNPAVMNILFFHQNQMYTNVQMSSIRRDMFEACFFSFAPELRG